MEQVNVTAPFNWNSFLGYSVILFLLINLCYIVMGLLAPVAFRIYGTQLTEKFGLIYSPRTDAIAFGESEVGRIKSLPVVKVTKVSVYDVISGLYLAVAVLHLCIVWYGLRMGLSWSLWALTFADLAIFGYQLMAARNFSFNITPLNLSDMFPYVLIPGLILPVATILGWIGLRINSPV